MQLGRVTVSDIVHAPGKAVAIQEQYVESMLIKYLHMHRVVAGGGSLRGESPPDWEVVVKVSQRLKVILQHTTNVITKRPSARSISKAPEKRSRQAAASFESSHISRDGGW